MDRRDNRPLLYSGVSFQNSSNESNMRKRPLDLDIPGSNLLPGMHPTLGSGPTPLIFPVHVPPPMGQQSADLARLQTPADGADLQRVRVRASKACDRCRSQKVKCSGEQPCVNCSKHNKECVFLKLLDNGTKLGRNLDTNVPVLFGSSTSAPAPDLSYVMHLENRVRYLELILAPHAQLITPLHINTGEQENVVPPKLNAVTSKWRFLRRHQNRLLYDLCATLYSTLLDENKALVSVPRKQYFGWNLSGVKYLPSEPLPSAPLVDVDQADLVDYFFREINCVFGAIHEPVFREQLVAYNELVKEDADKQNQSQESLARFNSAKLFLAQLYLMYALSIRLKEFLKPQGPSMAALDAEVAAFRYGYDVVNLLSFEWESFELIQAWILITLYLRISHRQTSANNALNRATTMVRLMGLGQNHLILALSTPYEQLKAKRIFWAVFTMERVFGLQTGRYGALPVEHVKRRFPTLDYSSENDTWIPKPAFALLHIARIATYVHTSEHDDFDLIKYQQVEKELEDLNRWFVENEFGDTDLFSKNRRLQISSLAVAQVKLHYYDLILCVHGKILFDFVGKRIVNEGLRIDRVFGACMGILDVLEKVHRAKLLFVPWYNTLVLLFNVGVNSLTLINAGQRVQQAKHMFRTAIRLITVLQKAAVHNDQGKILAKHRFTMARECLWALKMTSRTLSLRLQQDFSDLNNIGVDHGSSDVNKQHFSQMGIAEEDYGEGLSSQQAANPPQSRYTPLYAPTTAPTIPDLDVTPELVNSAGIDENLHLGNLQWFDQWMNFNYDI